MANLRRKFELRAEKTQSRRKVPSPSEKRSEKMRKHLRRGDSPESLLQFSCHTCKDSCGSNINVCGKPHAYSRCGICGQKNLHFKDDSESFVCDRCKEKRRFELNDKREESAGDTGMDETGIP